MPLRTTFGKPHERDCGKFSIPSAERFDPAGNSRGASS